MPKCFLPLNQAKEVHFVPSISFSDLKAMGFSIFFSKKPVHYFAMLVILILSLSVCMSDGVFPIFLSTALILILPSSFILTFSNQKVVKLCQTECIGSFQSDLPKESVALSEIQAQVEEEEEEEEEENEHDSSIGPSPDSYSESDSIIAYSPLTSDQESEMDWPDSGNLYGHFLGSSDGTISDEESLIEIVLPSGQFLASPIKEEEEEEEEERESINDFIVEMKRKKKKSPVAVDAEMNEEDNLIEIDISMGSIKVS